MTFLAPAWLAAALAASAALVLAHFFARHRPRPAALPTARFVPVAIARAPSPANRPSDLLLLVLRVLALLAIGTALARPGLLPPRRPVARVIVMDTTGAMSVAALRDSAVALSKPGDTIVASGGLSSGLVRAVRAASAIRNRADSLELVVISPLVRGSFDAATDSIRRLWPGRARLVHVPAAAAPMPRRINVLGSADDPIRSTVALLGTRIGGEARIVRGSPGAADTAFARAGGVLVIWPERPEARWPSNRTDTIGGVTSGAAVVVAPFARAARLPDDGHAIAHWIDGGVAAREVSVGAGCVRNVAIPLPATGDLVLRQSLRDVVDALTGDCGGAIDLSPAGNERISALAGAGGLLPSSWMTATDRRSSASTWLLGVAMLLLLIETMVRPRSRS